MAGIVFILTVGEGKTMIKSWLEAHWVAGAIFMAGALLLLLPVLSDRSIGFLLVYLASPLYMLHQVEEHMGDRFRTYANTVVFGGVEGLTVADVLWVNLPGVWGVNLAALYAAYVLDPGWGLAAAYLILVNGISHVAMAVKAKGYNPGLATGAVLFIPFGLFSIFFIPATTVQQVVGLSVSLLVHAGIILLVKHNLATHKAAGPVSRTAA